MDRPFSAVRTTGIYCRPGCGARPKPGNVQRYVSAAAAEAAGFRACLRCRPYRVADSLEPATSELICRAVRLVVDGVLDEGGEEHLAARLGISARHLRRRFVVELGVTPDALARSRRTHFARRLLDDTDLSMTDVAFAAGFGSVRQFNRSCREVFRATPSELRARRRRSDLLVPPPDGLALRLPVSGPLDWPALLEALSARAIPGVESVDATGYRRTIVLDGQPGAIDIRPGDDDEVLLRVHLRGWKGLIHLAEQARGLLALDTSRPPGAWDPLEAGVRAILGQRVSVAGTTRLVGRLVSTLGTRLPEPFAPGLTHLFPSAEQVADGDLDALGVSAARANEIRAFARAAAVTASSGSPR